MSDKEFRDILITLAAVCFVAAIVIVLAYISGGSQ